MLRVFQIFKDQKVEVFPNNNTFNVFELGRYEIVYTSNEIVSNEVYIEDINIDLDKISILDKIIKLNDFRYFEDYFGFASLKINNETFLFNIRIEKLKLSEIEDIFTYLWSKEDRLFNIFFSRSTYELDFKKNGIDLSNTSKLISFIERFILTFDQLYPLFLNTPHTVLRKKQSKEIYDSSKVSPDSLEWVLSNLDEVNFDESLKGHYNSIKINNKFGVIDHLFSIENVDSFNNYENQIILGSFICVLKKINNLKSEIKSNINIQPSKDDKYADFKDLKKIPFIKLFEDSSSLEKKVIKLYNKYSRLFKDTKPRVEKPLITTVFAQKNHYRKSFSLIKNLYNYKFDLFGEFKLLNISKLSRLYEAYNLFVIIDAIKQNLKLELFNIEATSNRNDELVERIVLKNNDIRIKFLYEHKYFSDSIKSQETQLRRIDISKGNFYHPDFIIEIFNSVNNVKKYFILDAKYSKFQTVKGLHLPSLMFKYILNTGISEESNSKISSLVLLFPNDNGQKIIKSNFYEPNIELIASKPNNEIEINEYIRNIFIKNIPNEYLSSNL